MIIETTRFGSFEVEPEDRLFFPEGILGLPNLKHFILLDHEGGVFQWLQACEDPDMAFVVIDPNLIVQDHNIKLNDSDLKVLGVEELQGTDEGQEIAVCGIVNVSDPRNPTVNLLAPICIAARTRRGMQIVQHHSGYSTRHEINRRPRRIPAAEKVETQAA